MFVPFHDTASSSANVGPVLELLQLVVVPVFPTFHRFLLQGEASSVQLPCKRQTIAISVHNGLRVS
jgi:hypothetical protein